MGKLIMVSNRLPVSIAADGTAKRTTGGLASALEGVNSEDEQLWVGWPGGTEEDFEDPAAVARSMEENGLRAVFLSREEVDGCRGHVYCSIC